MNQLKVGAILNYIAIAINMVVGFIYTPYLLRMLGQSEYGLYSLAASIIAYLTVLDLGFGNAIIRYLAKYRSQGNICAQEKILGMFFIIYIFIGLIALFCGGYIATNAENIFSANMTNSEVKRTMIMLWLMTFNIAFTFPMSIWGSIMSAYEKFVFQRIVSIIRSILNPIVMVILLAIGYKAVALVVVTTLFNVATLFVNWVYCKVKIKIGIRYGHFDLHLLKEICVYSFWIFLNAIMDRIYWSTGQFVLGVYRGSFAIAIFAVAIQLQQFYMMFSTAISSVFLPKITGLVVQGGNDKEISSLFIRTGRLQYLILMYILSSFIIFGKDFICVWAGPNYEDAYLIALLFLIPLTVPLIQNLGIVILQARNQMKFRSILYIIIALMSLGLSIPLAKAYGGIGCALATSGALILGQIIIMNIYYQYKQGIDIVLFWKEIFKMSFAPLILVLLCSLFLKVLEVNLSDITTLIICAFGFSLIFLLSIWYFSMNSYEKALFLTPINIILCKCKKND